MVGAKVTRLEAGGQEYTLFCSCDAYLQLEADVGPDVFGGLKDLDKLLRAAEILSEAGELLRRDYHYAPKDWYHAPPRRAVTPAQRTALYRAAMEAVGYGLTNEVPQQAEVDLYLLEEQKNGSGWTRGRLIRAGASVGYSVQDVLLRLTLGQLMDAITARADRKASVQ